MNRPFSYPLIVILLLAWQTLALSAAEPQPRKPGAVDKCPVCGMFVAKYPDFAAQIQFRDGKVAHFDGAKDLFKYYLNQGRYNPNSKPVDIAALYVTDYYSLAPVKGFTAFFVSGSDVYGPMGRELVPFAREKDAREFKKDHKGRATLTFKEVTPAIIKELE
jgi:copper chaperone NosL